VLVNDIVIKFHPGLVAKGMRGKIVRNMLVAHATQLWCRSRRSRRRHCAPSVHREKDESAVANGRNACANTRDKKCRHSVLPERTWL